MADNREGQDREGQESKKVTPETPETPSASDTPATPVVAEKAAAPVTSETPETPETPATPAETGIEGSKIMGNNNPDNPFANTVGVEQGEPVLATPAAVNGPVNTATAEQVAEAPVETPVETAPQQTAQATAPTAEGTAQETPVNTTAAPATEAVAEEDPENAPIKINGPDTNEVEAEKEAAAKKAQLDTTATSPTTATDKPAADTAAADDLAGDQPDVSRYRDLFHKKHFSTLQERWDGLQDVPQFQDALGENGEIRKSKYGFEMHFENGRQHTIEWHESLRGSGSEFIGMTRRTALFDKDDAFNVVSASRARGWKSLNVHGTDDQKAMLWVEAKLQGIEVTNYSPPKGHPAYDELAARAGEQMDKTPGVSNGEMGIPVIPAYAPSPEEEAAKIAANKKQAQENAAEKPAAKTETSDEATPEKREMSTPAQETAQNDGAQEVAQTATPASLDASTPETTADKSEATSTIAGGKLKDLGRGGKLGATEQERDADFLAFADKELGGDQQALAVISARLNGDTNAGPVPQQVLDAAKKQGVEVPEELKDDKPATAKPAAQSQDRDIPTTQLTLEQQMDRAIANEGNTPEVRDGLRDLKTAILEKKITSEDLSAIKLGGTSEGGVTAAQFETFSKALDEKLNATPAAVVAQVKNTNTGGPARKM